MSRRLAKKVLLIGWDAADWKIINPLLDSGMMPALESLVNNGVMGNIATLDPPMSPMLWTSIATGKHADQHGIMGFTEPAPEGKGVRPCMVTSRKVKAVWNMLMQSGYKTNVVGWWPSHPAEPVNGVYISNFYQNVTSEYGKPWPLAPGAVHPKEKEELFKQFRVHPGELTEAHILPFVPDAAKIDQEKDKHLSSLAKIIAECASVHAAATYILENEEWDFTAVYYDAVDHFCHGFMDFHPPKMEQVPQEMFDLYKGVVEGGYIFHDMMLGRLLEYVDDETTVILISDHGFHSDHLRPKGIPQEPAGPALQHRDYGIFVMKGPGIIKDERVYGTTLLDVAPTILTLFGLPIGHDMEGKSVVQAFENPPEINYVDSWEEIDGVCGMHPEDMKRDPLAEKAAMDQLIELGYIEKPEENIAVQIEKTVDENRYYLSRVLMNKDKHSEALPLLGELYHKDEKVIRYAFQYAKCLDALGRTDEASEVVELIIAGEEAASGEITEAEAGENSDLKPAVKPKREYPQLYLLKGTLEYARGNNEVALEYLFKAEQSDPRLPQLHQQLGNVYLKMRRIDEAERAFLKALEIDPESHIAHLGLSEVMMRKKDYESAASYALDSVGLLYHNPRAHLNLGIVLAKLGMYERAAQALEVSVAIVPGIMRAHRLLAYIYMVKLRDQEKADRHIEVIKKLRENTGEKKGL